MDTKMKLFLRTNVDILLSVDKTGLPFSENQ